MGTLLNATFRCLATLPLILCVGAAALPGQAASVKVDPSWLTANAATSSTGFKLVAGMTGANGGMNFNGATKGELTLTVPVNWHVTLHFVNNDPNLPHSVEVTAFTDPVPATPGKPAFAGAVSKDATLGVGTGAKEDVRFTADQAGAYLILCAVPGHAAAGMWIRLTVSATATMPEVQASTPAP